LKGLVFPQIQLIFLRKGNISPLLCFVLLGLFHSHLVHLSGHPPQTGAEFFFFAVLGMTGNAERAASLSIA
jgi:hypothetical protein